MLKGDLREVFATLDTQRDGLNLLHSKCDALSRDLAQRDLEVSQLRAQLSEQRALSIQSSTDLRAREAHLATVTAQLHVAQKSLHEISGQYDRLREASALAEAAAQRAPARRASTLSVVSEAPTVPAPLVVWSKSATERQQSLHEQRRSDAVLQQTRAQVALLKDTSAAQDAEVVALRSLLRRRAATAVAISIASCLSRSRAVGLRRGFDGLTMHALHRWTLQAAREQSSAHIRAMRESAEASQREILASRALQSWCLAAHRCRITRVDVARASRIIALRRQRVAWRVLAVTFAQKRSIRLLLERLALLHTRALRRGAFAAWRVTALRDGHMEHSTFSGRLSTQLSRACSLLGRRFGLRAAITAWRCATAAGAVRSMRLRARRAQEITMACLSLSASRRTARSAFSAMIEVISAKNRSRYLLERLGRIARAQALRITWRRLVLHSSSTAVVCAQLNVSEACIVARRTRAMQRRLWSAWRAAWLREGRVREASAVMRPTSIRRGILRCVRCWRSKTAAQTAAANRLRFVQSALLLSLRRSFVAGPTILQRTLGNTALFADSMTQRQVPVDEERSLLRSWNAWRAMVRKSLMRRARCSKMAQVLVHAARRSALRKWAAAAASFHLERSRATAAALMRLQAHSDRAAFTQALRGLGVWRRLARRRVCRKLALHHGAHIERKALAHVRAHALRAWASLTRERASAKASALASEHARLQVDAASTDAVLERASALLCARKDAVFAFSAWRRAWLLSHFERTTSALRQSRSAAALAGAAAKWTALSHHSAARESRRRQAVLALLSVVRSGMAREARAAADAASLRWGLSRWAQVALTGQAEAALDAARRFSAGDLQALHNGLRVSLRAAIAGASARSLCSAVAQLSLRPEITLAFGHCVLALWLVDAANATMKTQQLSGNQSLQILSMSSTSLIPRSTASVVSGKGGSKMLEVGIGEGLAGTAVAHFMGVSDMLQVHE
jgi:hypothetical protein